MKSLYEALSKSMIRKLEKRSLNDYYYQPRFKLDISLMRDASKLMIGTHDFKNFVSGEKDDTTATIKSITLFF